MQIRESELDIRPVDLKPKSDDDFYTACRRIQYLIDMCIMDAYKQIDNVEQLLMNPYEAAEIILASLKKIESYSKDRQKLNEEY